MSGGEAKAARRDASVRTRRALARFGLRPGPLRGAPSPDAPTIDRLFALPAGQTALITGPSGSGKSTLVRALVARLGATGQRVRVVSDRAGVGAQRAVIDHVGGTLDVALDALAAAGLGDATLLARPAGSLSEGQRRRLAIAGAMVSLGDRGGWLVCDEFCSMLDRVTAEAVTACVGRWARRRADVRVIAATAHEDMAGLLRPDLLVSLGPDVPPTITAGSAPASQRPLVVEVGAIEDYDRLGAHHYRAGRPATWTVVLRALRPTRSGRLLAGALVVSHPTLNSAWRDQPWPGRYTHGPRRARARRLNRELRCISRVVVEPRSRGMGVGRRLVEAYLRSPQTPATEAIGAMGAVCPFFERAGMRAYEVGVRAPDARLRDALHHAGWAGEDLLEDESVAEAVREAFVRRELRHWANASRATRSLLGLSWERLACEAGVRLSARVRAYAHVAAG